MKKLCNRLPFTTLLAGLSILSAGAVGCGPSSGGFWYFLANPREKVAAEYRLPTGPLAVLVDDPLGVIEPVQAQRELAEAIGNRLVEFGAHENIVPQQRLQRLRQVEPGFENLSTRQIGERVGADAVLYVLVTRFQLQDVPDSDVYRGELTARLKVINAKAKPGDIVRLWPQEPRGRAVDVALPAVSGRDESVRQRVVGELVSSASKKAARLFCDYQIDRANPDA